MYGAVPPAGVTEIAPVAVAKQETGEMTPVAVTAGGGETMKDRVDVQPPLLVTVTVYVPSGRPVIVLDPAILFEVWSVVPELFLQT